MSATRQSAVVVQASRIAQRSWHAALAAATIVLCAAWVPAHAESYAQNEVYGKRIESANTIAMLGSDLFGDSINLQTGALSFSVTDVDIPGNFALPVRFTRTFTVENTFALDNDFGPVPNRMLADWDVALPRITATYPVDLGWVSLDYTGTGNNTTNRCDVTSGPGLSGYPNFMRDSFWQGLSLEIPGVGGGALLAVTASEGQPSTGGPYPWTTTDGQIRLSCLGQIASGSLGSGQAFIAHTPDGSTYKFDWMSRRAIPGLRHVQPNPRGGVDTVINLHLAEYSLYVTEVKDRFGNTVNYSYVNNSDGRASLAGIAASDGRKIAVTYYDAQPHLGRIKTVTATQTGPATNPDLSPQRTWTYKYTSYSYQLFWNMSETRWSLHEVVQPDSRKWSMAFRELTHTPLLTQNAEPGSSSCMLPPMPQLIYDHSHTDIRSGTVTHPSGAQGTFRVRPEAHGRSNINMSCTNFTTPHNDPENDVNIVGGEFYAWRLIDKTLSGAGVPAASPSTGYTWSYQYDHSFNYHLRAGATEARPVCTDSEACLKSICRSGEYTCNDTARTLITLPTGDWEFYVFGNNWQYDEGKLLRVHRGKAANHPLNALEPTVASESVTHTYDLDEDGRPYPSSFGESPRGSANAYDTEYHRPILRTKTHRDGVTFAREVPNSCDQNLCMDERARPTKHVLSSSLGYIKTEETSYYDDAALWVLGQVDQRKLDGVVTADNNYYEENALLHEAKAFGQLQQIFTYHSNGTIHTVTDARGKTTTLNSWMRGIPESITYPDLTGISAEISTLGEIVSVTDPTNNKTEYLRDNMGRISRITPPEDSVNNWLPTNISYSSNASDPVLDADHWLRTESRGTYLKKTHFDALWRPVVEVESDTNIPGTARYRAWKYDAFNRVTFEAYPMPSVTNWASLETGTHTTYDELGRVKKIGQNAEDGVSNWVETAYDYLDGFKTQVTNPNGFTTETTFQAYDQPDTSFPVSITQVIRSPETNSPNDPGETVSTAISRDAWGKPLSMTRSGTSAGTDYSATRSYVYDSYQRLCKMVEPETNATVLKHDVAGNLEWSASGQDLLSTSLCDHTQVDALQRVTRTYDDNGRLDTVTFPDGLGNQVWDYWDDGLPKLITTSDATGNGNVNNSYTYNSLRLLEGETLTVGSHNFTLGYGYNRLGHLSSLDYPNKSMSFAPNALGQPTQVGSTPMNFATGVTYYPSGVIDEFTYGNGIVHKLTRNERQLPSSSTDSLGNTVIHHEIFDYDPNGNILGIADEVANSRDRTMTYDGLDRLMGVASSMFGNASYSYDPLDNLRSISINTDNTSQSSAPKRDVTLQYNAMNRLSGTSSAGVTSPVAYDDRGNIDSRNGFNFNFDHGNRLRSVSGNVDETYRYDGHGRRVLALRDGKSIYSFYGQDGVLRYQRDEHTGLATRFIYLGGSLIAEDAELLPAAAAE